MDQAVPSLPALPTRRTTDYCKYYDTTATTIMTATIYRLGHPDVYDRYDYCYHTITTFAFQGFGLEGEEEEEGRSSEERGSCTCDV